MYIYTQYTLHLHYITTTTYHHTKGTLRTPLVCGHRVCGSMSSSTNRQSNKKKKEEERKCLGPRSSFLLYSGTHSSRPLVLGDTLVLPLVLGNIHSYSGSCVSYTPPTITPVPNKCEDTDTHTLTLVLPCEQQNALASPSLPSFPLCAHKRKKEEDSLLTCLLLIVWLVCI
jgi:hypothetical protein